MNRSDALADNHWLSRLVASRASRLLTALLLLASAAPRSTADEPIPLTPAGEWLAQNLDQLDVEKRWLRGEVRIDWKSGLPVVAKDERQKTLANVRTHCSAFAAAAADTLGIYLLRPPEHPRLLLSNAQFDWLASEAGAERGWQAVPTPIEAQQRANLGEFVVAAWKNAVAKRAGHIAIVRPAVVPPERIEKAGPQIIQAGFNNYRSARLNKGFDLHPGAWAPSGAGGVRFYAHPIDPKLLAGQ